MHRITHPLAWVFRVFPRKVHSHYRYVFSLVSDNLVVKISSTWLSSVNTLHRAAVRACLYSWKAPQFNHGGLTAYPARPVSLRLMRERNAVHWGAKGVMRKKGKCLSNLQKRLSTISTQGDPRWQSR